MTKDTIAIICTVLLAAAGIVAIGKADISELRADMRDIRTEVRELRGLLITHIASDHHSHSAVASAKTDE